MDRLEDLWICLTSPSLPRSLTEFSEKIEKCQSTLSSGLSSYTRLTTKEATSLTSDDVLKILKGNPKNRQVPDVDLRDEAELLASVINIIYVDIPSASRLLEESAEAEGKTVATLTRERTGSPTAIVLKFYFQRRRLIMAVHRYILKTLQSFEIEQMHPYQKILLKFSGDLETDKLLIELGFALGLLRDYAGNPSFDLQQTWLSLQLQDLRDLLVLLLDVAAQIAKNKSTVESIVRPLITAGQCLQKFPVSSDRVLGGLQLQLVQQVNSALTAFVFYYFSIGVQIFLRNKEAMEYLDEALPTGSSLTSSCPASVLWFLSRLEMSPQHERSTESLTKILGETNPFLVLTALFCSDAFTRSTKEILAGPVFDFGEKFLRMSSTDTLGSIASVYVLTEQIFQYPKEAIRFWQRWSEGAGTELAFSWGHVFVSARDALPKSFGSLVEFTTALLKGFPAGSTAISQLDKMLWNLEWFTEEVNADDFRDITLVKLEAEVVSVVRTEVDRLPYGTGGVVIPAGAYGRMVNCGQNVQLRWILRDSGRFSIWSICDVFLNRVLAEWKDHFAQSYETVGKICKFYCAAIKASPATHDDLEEILRKICQSLGCLLHGLSDNSCNQSSDQLPELCQMVFSICTIEVEFRGHEFFHDLDLLAPVFPKATHTTTFDFDWIRNGDPAWFSTLWQTLCQNSTQAGFIKTLDKLASVLRSSIQVSGVSATNDKLLQQSSIFILNIALPCLAQLEDPSQGTEILGYALASLQDAQNVQIGPSIAAIATDCLLEGPAGQALVELLNSSNQTLGLFVRNINPTKVEDFSVCQRVQFVQLVLEAIRTILELLPIRLISNHVTSFERALLTVEKTRQMESISVNTGDNRQKHPVLQLIRLITSARDAKIVQSAIGILSRLIVLQQPSLMTIAKNDAEEFLKSVFWLLREGTTDVITELWRFLALCDAKQPRLLDLFINLAYSSEKKKYVVDIETLPSLLDVVLETLSNPPSQAVLASTLSFCLEIFSSKNDYVEYLSMNQNFWHRVFRILEDIPKTAIGWEQKLSSAYALDLIAIPVASRSLNSVVLSPELIDSEWTFYVSDLLPRIFVHLNKDIPKLLHALDEDSDTIKILTRFFTSWSSLHLLVFQKESLESIVTEETRINTIRTQFVLLNRSLLNSSGSSFVQVVAAALFDALHRWRQDLTMEFFASIFHIVEDFTVLVCGAEEQTNWNDTARHAILSVTLKVLNVALDLRSKNDANRISLPVLRLQNVMKAALEVVAYSALDWDPRLETEELKGVMLSYAAGVVKNCLRLTPHTVDVGMQDMRKIFLTNCLHEILLTKVVQLVSIQRLPQIAQSFLGLFLLMSESKESAATLNQTGFSTCLGLPLAGSIGKFTELLTERDVQSATVEEVIASKERSVDGQDVFEVYLTALAVQFNIMRADRFRFEDALKFILTQITSIPYILEALRGTPTMFTFRLAEMLTRLLAEASRHSMSSAMKQSCLADVPALFHAMCGQLMRRSEKLIDDRKNLRTPTLELVMSTAVNCLQVLNSTNPGIATLLTEDEFLTEPPSVQVILEYSFANPASISLSPNLSFGTFVHVMKTGVEILSKEDPVAVFGLIFAAPSRKSVSSLSKLVDFVERSAHFFMFQAVAFALGLSDLTGERWQETLRELNSEIVDLRHVLQNFLNNLEENSEPNTPTDASRPASFLGLLVENMLSFRVFYDDIKDGLGDAKSFGSLAVLTGTPKTERKKVTFML